MNNTALKLALPSKGALEQPCLDFLAAAGMRVSKPNKRQYSASIEELQDVVVLFQRASDILPKVAEGSADLGITGLDVVSEGRDNHKPVVVIEKLGFGRCELVVAVPETWVDVSTLADLADLSLAIKASGRDMRIVTKYPNVTRDWLYSKGIIHFTLVDADGALEAAPAMGYADLIVDLTETGTTLRENKLKTIEQGVLLRSEACLIGNPDALLNDPQKLQITRHILELIEAHNRARKYVSVVANVQGLSPEEVGQKLIERPALSGLIGPGVTRIHPRDATGMWYEINIVVERSLLLQVVEHLRAIKGTGISVSSPDYVFDSTSHAYDRLLDALESLKSLR